MSEIKIGNMARTKVGKVVLIVQDGPLHYAKVDYGDTTESIYCENLELVPSHQPPAKPKRWEGVKRVTIGDDSEVYSVLHRHGEWIGVQLNDKVMPWYTHESHCTPYTPPVEVGSRVRCCNEEAFGIVRWVNGKEACIETDKLWIVLTELLVVIE